jgi:NitT/TauT family transport system permease protein
VECASVVTVFTAQVWNMTFGFYHSMVTIPQDLHEAATNYRLTALQRFQKLEVPASMHSLIWNCMMSFGAGWFAVLSPCSARIFSCLDWVPLWRPR